MRWPPESWPWPRSLLLFGIVFLIYVIASMAAIYGALALGFMKLPLDPSKNGPLLIALQGLIYVPLVATILIGLPMASKLPLRELGFRMPRARDLGIGVLGAVAMFAVIFVIGQAVDAAGVKSPEQAVELFKHLTTTRDRVLFVAIACVFAPMSEELFFRVFIFSSVRRYAPTAVAAAASAVLFGLAHVSPSSASDIVPQLLAVSLPLVGGGVVLAYVYEISGCYWSNVVTHACFNSVSVVGLLVFHLK